MLRKLFVIFCLCAVLVQQQAQAQALPVAPLFTGVVNRVVGKAIATNLARRGISVAANDAVFANTMAFVGKAANDASYASAAVTTVATLAGAPVWLTVALGVGALAAVGAVSWGLYKLSQSSGPETNPNGSPTPLALSLAPASPSTSPPPSPAAPGSYTLYLSPMCNPAVMTCPSLAAIPSNLPYYASDGGFGGQNYAVIAGVSGLDLAQQLGTMIKNFDCGTGTGLSNCQATYVLTGSSVEPAGYTVRVDWSLGDGSTNFRAVQVGALPNPSYVRPLQSVSGNLNSLVPEITPQMLNEPLPPYFVAQVANRLWQNAANAPGYNGAPYSATDPITASDVQTGVASDPSISPTWKDLIQGTPTQPGSSNVPISPDPISPSGPVITPPVGGTSSNVNVVNTPNVNVVNKVAVDFGTNPNLPTPTTESVPTIQMILSPLVNLMPDLRSWTVPAHNTKCPEPSFSIWGDTFTFQSHCTLLESHRDAIHAVFSAAFILAALFIVLAA